MSIQRSELMLGAVSARRGCIMTALASPRPSAALTDRSHGEQSWAGDSPTYSYAGPVLCLRTQKNRNGSGFTLLDIVIVVTLVGLLAGITFPQIGAMQTRFAIRGYVNTFMSAHAMARTTAVRQGGVAELHIDATNDLFWVEVDTTIDGSGVMDTVGVVVDVSEFGVDLSSTQTLLCFDGRGLASTAAGCATAGAVVAFTRGDEADTITTSALGKILR